jgi:hypothetical protein
MRRCCPVHRPAGRLAVMLVMGAIVMPGRLAFAESGKAPAPSGRVQYQMTGPTSNGTMTLSWTDNGRKYRQDIRQTHGVGKRKGTMELWNVGDGSYVYTHHEMMGKQVMRMKIPPRAGGKGSIGTLLFSGGAETGPVVGKATLLGKPCEIHLRGPGKDGVRQKSWIWNGLPLRMETTSRQGPAMTMVATRLEAAPKLPPSLFQVPAGYQVHDLQPHLGRPGAPPLPHR